MLLRPLKTAIQTSLFINKKILGISSVCPDPGDNLVAGDIRLLRFAREFAIMVKNLTMCSVVLYRIIVRL